MNLFAYIIELEERCTDTAPMASGQAKNPLVVCGPYIPRVTKPYPLPSPFVFPFVGKETPPTPEKEGGSNAT